MLKILTTASRGKWKFFCLPWHWLLPRLYHLLTLPFHSVLMNCLPICRKPRLFRSSSHCSFSLESPPCAPSLYLSSPSLPLDLPYCETLDLCHSSVSQMTPAATSPPTKSNLSLFCASALAGTEFYYSTFYISLHLLLSGCLIQSDLGMLESSDDASFSYFAWLQEADRTLTVN